MKYVYIWLGTSLAVSALYVWLMAVRARRREADRLYWEEQEDLHEQLVRGPEQPR